MLIGSISRCLGAQQQSLGGRAGRAALLQVLFRLLQALLERGPQRLDELAVALDVAPDVAAELADLLARDGLVRHDGDRVRVA